MDEEPKKPPPRQDDEGGCEDILKYINPMIVPHERRDPKECPPIQSIDDQRQ